MGVDADRELVSELAQIALEKVAPEELAVFDETADDFFRDPEGVLDPAKRDEAVGFGLDAALATPFVLAVVVPVVQFLARTVADTAKEESRPVIASLVRRLFRRGQDEEPDPDPDPDPDGPALTAEQVVEVRTIAFDRARALGLPEAQAGLLADSIGGGVLAAG